MFWEMVHVCICPCVWFSVGVNVYVCVCVPGCVCAWVQQETHCEISPIQCIIHTLVYFWDMPRLELTIWRREFHKCWIQFISMVSPFAFFFFCRFPSSCSIYRYFYWSNKWLNLDHNWSNQLNPLIKLLFMWLILFLNSIKIEYILIYTSSSLQDVVFADIDDSVTYFKNVCSSIYIIQIYFMLSLKGSRTVWFGWTQKHKHF